ncbi:unnamed protein product [Leptidea sinapis]|uniref:Uncharacterized protein n=1 Tax=Leptidea sinapis TaxID=189913 RepID=A0A5E4QY00_9NEOP|nr:unnamed protein product [Leptidea sinapis]
MMLECVTRRERGQRCPLEQDQSAKRLQARSQPCNFRRYLRFYKTNPDFWSIRGIRMKFYIRFCFLIVVLHLTLHSCDGLRNRGYSSRYENRGYNSPKQKTPMNSSGASLPPNPSRRGLGISAWGIVTLIVSLILATAGLYYFSICYPILCKKSRKYDMIERTTVV